MPVGEIEMRGLKVLFLATVIVLLPFAAMQHANAQVVVGTPGYGAGYGDGYGYAQPACSYGYYNYAPYACAPYGYYGANWFYNGLFIGIGPWAGWGYYGRGYYGGWGRGGWGYRGGYGYGRGGYGYGRGGYGGGYGHGGYPGGGHGGYPGGGGHGGYPGGGGGYHGGGPSGGGYHGGGGGGGHR